MGYRLVCHVLFYVLTMWLFFRCIAKFTGNVKMMTTRFVALA